MEFFTNNLHEVYESRRRAVADAVKGAPDTAIDASDPTTFSEVFAAHQALTNIPQLVPDQIECDEPAFTQDSPIADGHSQRVYPL